MIIVGMLILAGFMPHQFMPHGNCYLWDPLVLWLHVISDALITLSYYCIPVVLIYFIRKHRGIPFNRIFWMFGTFILACGTTHLMEIWNVWHGNYVLAGVIKAMTAVVSVITAAMLIPLVPKVMTLPGQFHLQQVNRTLQRELARRQKLDAPISSGLRRGVTAGFIVAVLLTIFSGFASWRDSRQAEEDALWVSHTHEVMETIQRTTRHIIEAETGARAFALTGEEPLLAHYQSTRETIRHAEDSLRSLTADNPSQQQRIGELAWQVDAAMQLADAMIAHRRKAGPYPGGKDALESERQLDVVRAKTTDIYAEEASLLDRRTQTAKASRQLTGLLAIPGVLLGLGMWVLATLAVRREINISEHARTQLHTLNAELEQRVEQRTAALQSEIAERKRAEERLAGQAEELSRQTEELARSGAALEAQTLLLRSVLDSMAEGLVVADEQGRFVIWNPAAEKILGRGAANVPPPKWSEYYRVFLSDMITPAPPDQLTLARAVRGESSTDEVFVRNPAVEGGVWIEVSGGPLKDKDGTLRGGVVSFRDITQRKADEREIRKLNDDLECRVVTRTAQLEAANKELEAFSYSISHDLRAPLRHIGGFARILIEDFGPSLPVEAQHHLQRIGQSATRMGQLVDELLNLTRVGRQALTMHATDLNLIVHDAMTVLEPETAGRHIDWVVADLPFAECDATLVRQVFQNLIGNALKYSRLRAQTIIEIGQTTKDGQVVIFIRDNGVGFNMKYADKLFGVFQRLHRPEDFEGTGVGLAIVQRIIQKHGGRIWAEAELDRGATFYFTLCGFESSAQTNSAAAAGGSI